MNEFLKVFIFFIIYAHLGWVLEVIYHMFTKNKFINRGFLNGPICPIYGFGALIMLFFLEKLGDNIFLIFVGGFFFSSILEYITGYILELVFNTKWWDYSKEKFNLNGYICLKFSIIWGLVSVVLVKAIHPLILNLINLVGMDLLITLAPYIFLVFVVDGVYTVLSLVEFRKVLHGIEETTLELKSIINKANEQISEKLEKVVENKENKEEEIVARFMLAISKKFGNRPMRYKKSHIKYIKSYPSLMNKEWRKRVNDMLNK